MSETDVQRAQRGASLGQVVREHRQAARWTQERLAAVAEVSVRFVQDVEQGVSVQPRPVLLGRLTAALGITSTEAAALTSGGEKADGCGSQSVPLRLEVLGPLKVWHEGAPVLLGSARRRAVLGLLALRPGEVVTLSSIIDALWETEPPQTAVTMVHTYVSRLRAVLDPAGDGRDVLETVGDGYRLRLESAALDLVDSRQLADQARSALHVGDAAGACERFGRALALWRSEPLADVEVLRGHPLMVRVEQEYAALLVEYAEVASAYGWHDQVLPTLSALAERCPLDERAHAALMTALAGVGRQAAALELYEQVRHRLDEELGVRPGPVLAAAHSRVLHQEVPGVEAGPARLTGDGGRSAEGEAASRAPMADGLRWIGLCQLPPTVADFTDRGDEAEQVHGWLTGEACTGVTVVAVSGPPGMGKTALATHVAHLARERFPDAQLWASLDGGSGRPRDPGEVLGEWLRALGVHGSAIPESVGERAGLFRSRLADRRVLVVADDAASADQVNSLLPGTAGCALLVTSRRQLADLPGAHLMPLAPLPTRHAVELLGKVAGTGRVAADVRAARDLVAACGRLPLAVRIAGAKLAARPSAPVGTLASSMVLEQQRLDVLRVGDLSVRASIASGYEALSDPARHAFMLLGMLGPCDVAEWVIAALLGRPGASAVVDELVDRSMLNVVGTDATGQPRYRLHDLLRDYATEQAHSLSEVERGAAITRAHNGWLQLSALASDLLPPEPFYPRRKRTPIPEVVPALVAERRTEDPWAWFQAERFNLLAATELACLNGDHHLAVQLAECQAQFLHFQDRHDDAARNWQAVLVSATEAGDSMGAARARLRLAGADDERGYSADAMEELSGCIEIFERTEDAEILAFAFYWMSSSAWNLRMHEVARRSAERGLEVARRVGLELAELSNLRMLGLSLARLGDREGSVTACERAVRIADDLGEGSYRQYALHNLLFAYVIVDLPERAVELWPKCLELARQQRDAAAEATLLGALGDAYYGLGRYEEAAAAYLSALPVFRDRALHRLYATCLMRLGYVHHALRKYDEAAGYLKECLPIFGELGPLAQESRAREVLAACLTPTAGSDHAPLRLPWSAAE